MKNVLSFDADANVILCLQVLNSDSNKLIIEAKATNFTTPIIQYRTNGGTVNNATALLVHDFYTFDVPEELYINSDVSTLEIRVMCSTTSAYSEWILIRTEITDASQNVMLVELESGGFMTKASNMTADLPIILLDHTPTVNDIFGYSHVIIQYNNQSKIVGRAYSSIYNVTDIFVEIATNSTAAFSVQSECLVIVADETDVSVAGEQLNVLTQIISIANEQLVINE